MSAWSVRGLVFLAAALCSAGAISDQETWLFSGFGTAGAVWVEDRDVFFNHPAKPRQDARRPDFGADSLIGVQASWALGERTNLTLQLMSAEDYRGSYRPRVTWAYLRHDLAPGTAVRLGRLRAPFFMFSDSLNVNYAHPWIRPPVEVYGLNPFNDMDGVDLLYQRRFGTVDVELQPYFLARGKIRFPEGEASLRRYAGLNANLASGSLNLQFGHGRGDLSVEYGDLLLQFVRSQLLVAGLAGEAARLSGKRGHARFDSVGFQWDDGSLQVIGEYARRRASRYVTNAHGWHLTGAYRFGKLAPFVTLAGQRLDKAILSRTLGVPGLATYLESRNQAQRSITVGARWDVHLNTALKAQWTRNRIDRASWGAFFPKGSPLETSPAGRTVDMVSVSVDFTF